MHNVSIQKIKELAHKIAMLSDTVNSDELLEQTRELYENTILLHYTKANTSIAEGNGSVDFPKTPIKPTHPEIPEEELSVQERIRQIMNAAPKFEDKNTETPKVEEPENKTDTIVEEIEISKEIHTPIKDLEEEFEDAIAADYAADLFEKADKKEITKRSLNDKLSQSHIQIGLNDRIAFVKHLFNDNQADFNRVLSQLNSFQSYDKAINFIDNIVKPDYNWEEESTYVERFMMLVERRFI